MRTVPEQTDATAIGPASAGSCCSAFYEQDWVRYLAGDIFHPGGEALTLRMVESMSLGPGARVLDLGCGAGSTALLLADRLGMRVSGVDLSAANVARACERATSAGSTAHFARADVHHLPFGSGTFDAALAECTLSLFNERARSLAEIARVLRPAGQLGVSDMAVGGPLPADIAGVLAPWTCLENAMTEEQYRATFEAAGYTVEAFSDESEGLQQLILTLKRKLVLMSAGTLLAGGETPPLNPAEVLHWLNRFRAEVGAGTIRYLRFQLRRSSQGAPSGVA